MKKICKLMILGMLIVGCFLLGGCGQSKKEIAQEKAKEFVQVIGEMNDTSKSLVGTIAELSAKWDKYPHNGVICAQNMLKVENADNIESMAGWGTYIETLFDDTDYDIENQADREIMVEKCLEFQNVYTSIPAYDEKAYQLLQEIKENDEETYDELKEYYLLSSDYSKTVLGFVSIEYGASSANSYFNSVVQQMNEVDELRKRIELDYK
ncbi:MAG: hypothetical protein IJD40_00200 [Lachnospiraceae bacterium]|nr:hypothetical protein [Lachnospiraceae bacterium]